MTLRFAALGLDHRHIYGMAQGMVDAGAVLTGFWTDGTPQPLDGFVRRFPDAPRAAELERVLEDDGIDLVLIAAPPERRADLAIAAMRHGKDVMVDKPGCIAEGELARLRETVAETGRIWSVDFSERFEVPSTAVASRLVREGAIGRVIHTVGLGPHRLNAPVRPDWFWDAARYGGILTDIASHQIEQFLHFTGSEDAEIMLATAANLAHPDRPRFQDFGEVALRSDTARGYVRVDWFTADGLPTWGDGRLFLTGTEGTIELRKYVDVAGRPGPDHLFLTNGTRSEHIDCAAEPLTYFRDLAADVRDRTETACPQARTFKVHELSMRAQRMATDSRPSGSDTGSGGIVTPARTT